MAGIFKLIFLNENVRITIKISLKFVPKGPVNNIPALAQIMAWRRPDDKPFSEPIMVSLPTYICVTQPQCVNSLALGVIIWRHRPLSTLVQIMACCIFSANPSPEAMETYCQSDPYDQISVKFKSTGKTFYSPNCISKYGMPTVGHFIQVSMCSHMVAKWCLHTQDLSVNWVVIVAGSWFDAVYIFRIVILVTINQGALYCHPVVSIMWAALCCNRNLWITQLRICFSLYPLDFPQLWTQYNLTLFCQTATEYVSVCKCMRMDVCIHVCIDVYMTFSIWVIQCIGNNIFLEISSSSLPGEGKASL